MEPQVQGLCCNIKAEGGTWSRPPGQRTQELDLLRKKRGMVFGRQRVHVCVSNYCEFLSSALLTEEVDQDKEVSNTMLPQRSRER